MTAAMTKRRQTKKQTKNPSLKANQTLPFVEHFLELRRRLLYIALSVGGWTAAAYAVQQHLVNILLQPSGKQQFIYTSPGGGIDFLFRVCVYTGIAFSIPVIFFQLLRYVEPLIRKDSTRFILFGSFISGVLALGGILFGYFFGLPAALGFLLHQFTSAQIHPLVTIQSYIAFVTVYMLGSAMMFQVPLIILFINRIRPLKPKTLLHYERWVILFAFVASGLMNPSPNIFSQLFVAGPIIITYQLSIIFVAIVNRKKRSAKITKLMQQDALAQAERLKKRQAAYALRLQPDAPVGIVNVSPAHAAQHQKAAKKSSSTVRTPRPQAAPLTPTASAARTTPQPPIPLRTARSFTAAQRAPVQRHIYISDLRSANF